MADLKVVQPAPGGGGRSVAYPFITLQTGIKRAQELWDHEGKNLVPVSVAVRHWGYGEKSSGGKQTIAALKQFTLLRDTGEGDKRQVCLSPRAMDILLEPGTPKAAQAIREAAISPKIYRELLTMWRPEALPSDQTIAAFLLREKDFNRNAVEAFIKDFKANIKFSELTSSDTISPTTEQPLKVEPFVGVPPMASQAAATPTGGSYGNVPQQDTFTLDEGQVILRWPSKMSAESFEDFKAWVELQLRKIGRSIGEAKS